MRIFLDNMLVMAQMLKEISQEKETLIFLLQKLSFMINLKNSSNTSEGNRVFGVTDKFSKHDINLSSGKSFGYPKQMHTRTPSPNTTIMELTKLLGKLWFTVQAVFTGRIQCRYLKNNRFRQ